MYSLLLLKTYRHHIKAKKYKEINLLLTKERVKQHFTKITFRYWKGTFPFYVNELFVPYRNTYKTRSYLALEIPLIKVT